MLPPNFTFSASNLQAYHDCPRRFWLAYIEQLPWPAVEVSPVQEHEELVNRGTRFHRLVERTELQMDPALIAAQIDEANDHVMAKQYADYLTHRPNDLPTEVCEVEMLLGTALRLHDSAHLGSNTSLSAGTSLNGDANPNSDAGPSDCVRLAAKYDLITVEPQGRAVIVDWKTGKRAAAKAQLQQHLQSLVYPFVLVEASRGLPWGPIRPEQVEMRYWFTAAPTQPISFVYDGSQHDHAGARLRNLIGGILRGQGEADFPKVEDTPGNRKRFCAFCVYRSRCNRGAAAGDVEELIDPTDYFSGDIPGSLEFTMDEVEELAF
jgi:RecB family exonuclease